MQSCSVSEAVLQLYPSYTCSPWPLVVRATSEKKNNVWTLAVTIPTTENTNPNHVITSCGSLAPSGHPTTVDDKGLTAPFCLGLKKQKKKKKETKLINRNKLPGYTVRTKELIFIPIFII